MTPTAPGQNQWLSNNENFLSAALDWLKLKLQVQVGAIAEHASDPGSRLFKRATSPPPAVSEYDVRQAAHKMDEAANVEPPPALRLIGNLFGLTPFEQQVLLLCAAMELDTQIAPLCAQAQDAPNRPYPTFALALSLFDHPTWDIVSQERPLRYWRLVEANSTTTQPLTTSPLRADERIVSYLKGLNALDDRLRPFVMPLTCDRATLLLPPSQEETVQQTLMALQRASHHTPAVVQLVGTDPLSQQLIVQAVAAELKLYPYRLAAQLLPSQLSELEILERLCQRESRLLPILFYLDAHTLESAGTGQSAALTRFLSRSQGLFLIGTREIQSGVGRPGAVIDVDKPTPAEQAALWESVLAEAETQEWLQDKHQQAALLSGQFRLNALTIQQVAEAVLSEQREQPEHEEAVGDRLWQSCQVETRPHLDTLAQRLDPRATWADLVLPDDETTLLHQIADQVRHRHRVYETWGFHRRMNRGLGISTLFAGESGTGKTMAAEVIANELRLDLYRIDLSAVVSKYIGETEKNLRRLFDAAEDGGAILFFDEADALFGKRSEVKDSHDRYANIEINYLLQRIESYRGLAILATNFKNAIDTAFLRRLRFVVNFPFPGVPERQAIWQKAFPPETPQADLNFKQLARFNLTGGNIHNIVLNAAFLAAQSNTAVTMPQVLMATRNEFRKLDRPINEADFQYESKDSNSH